MDSWKHPMTSSRDTAALIIELACSECEDGKLCELTADDEWSDSNSDSDSEANTNEVSFYKWETPDKNVMAVRITLPFDEAVDMFKASVTVLQKSTKLGLQ